MKKFDLKKFIAENKATFHSSLREGDLMKSVGKGLEYEATEEMIRDYADRLLGAGVDDVEDLANYYLDNPEELPEPMEYEFFENNFDDILSLAMTGLDEGKKSKKYYKDAEADDAEHIKALEKDMKDDKKASKKLKEVKNFSVKLLVPTVYYDVETGELADSPYDWYTEDELEDADVTSYDNGDELAMVVFDGDMERAKQMEKQFPGLFKVMGSMDESKSSKMKVSELKAKIKENSDPRMDSAYVKYDTLYDFVDQKMVEGDDEAEALLKSKPSYDDLYDFVDQKMVEGDDEAEALLNKINKVNENKSSKMKVSELKAKIKEMVLSEMNLDVDNMEDAPESEVDFLAELEGMLKMGSKFDDEGYEGSDDHFQDTIDESGLWPALMKFKDEGFSLEHVVGWIEANWYMINEADEKAAEEEAAADVTVDDTETTDVETTAEVNPNVKAVQDSLTQAQAAAQKLGDKKLIDQIGNTITFFTRTHVVEKPGTVAESIVPLLKKILK